MNEHRRIDRIDNAGNIREHVLRVDDSRTLCGLTINPATAQPPAGNAKCGRCAVIAAMRLDMRDAERHVDCDCSRCLPPTY